MNPFAPSQDTCVGRAEPLPFVADVKVLLVPGLNGSPDAHWQTVWEQERADCERAELGAWSDPDPDTWIERLDHFVQRQRSPLVLVAHSLGCIATVLWSHSKFHRHRDTVLGAILVAPCDTEATSSRPLRRFAPLPRSRLEMRTILVASTDDPFATIVRSRQFASAWGSKFVNIGRAGHINADSGLGSWRFGQRIVDRMKQARRP